MSIWVVLAFIGSFMVSGLITGYVMVSLLSAWDARRERLRKRR